MSYISEELINGYYQDNNTYTEIGELHASSKNAVTGKIDSRYKNTKKTSLLSPDSDRIIYNFSSDSRVADMAIREAHESITEKMIFIGKDFFSLYDSDTGNFVLKEPHDFLKTLMNSYADALEPGLGSLDISDKDSATEKLSYNSFNYVCKNLKYVISVDTYFLIISKLDNGKYVIFRFNPDTLIISKFKPRAFYTGPGSEEILDKPFVKDNVLYLFTLNTNKSINFWSTSINDESADFIKDNTSLSGLGSGGIDKVKYTKTNDIVKIFNISEGELKGYAFDLTTGISSGFDYTVSGESEENYYEDATIKQLKTVAVSNTIHIILLLSNGIVKVIDNGYLNETISISTKNTSNPISYFIENTNDSFTKPQVLRFYDNKAHCKILFDNGNNNSDSAIGLLSGNGSNSFVSDEFTRVDDVVTNYEGNATVIDYINRNNHTMLIGYYSENGIIKPLIKDFYSKHVMKNYPDLTDEDKEYARPFNNGIEADSGISVVKNIPFGTNKLVQIKMNPIISEEADDGEEIYFREGDSSNKYTTGSDLWKALNETGIPYNTQVSTIGRIILDGYDIPIESVLITPADNTETYGSTLLSFDKNFNISDIDKKYLKLGDVMYPGILFKNNKGFLNDAIISNVYNVDGAITYYDANNGNLFENTLALTIKASVHVNINDNDILVVASNSGKIASINIVDGSYITSEGNTFGKNPPNISSSNITNYNFAEDGEILTIINNSKNVLTILYTSGKIIRYDIANNTVTTATSPYVSDKDCGEDRISTAFCVSNNTLAYVVNDESKKIAFFDCEFGTSAGGDVCSFDNSNIYSNTLVIGNNVYYCDGTNLNKFNTISKVKSSLKAHNFTNISAENNLMISYDYNDRIYLANGSIMSYYSLSENTMNSFINNKITVGGFLAYIGNNIITINKTNNKISIIDSEGNITPNSNDDSIDISDSKNKYIVSEAFIKNNKVSKNVIIFNGTNSKCVTISDKGLLLETIKTLEASDNASVCFYNKTSIIKGIGTSSSNNNYSNNLSILNISDISEIDDVSSNVKILGFVNNILYSLQNTTIKTKDFRKSHSNTFNTLYSGEIDLSEESDLSNDVTSLGFVDNGNVLAIGYNNGAIESVFLPEYNSGNGFFKHDHGDVLESYVRTTYLDCTPDVDTTLSELEQPVENGKAFIGWSYSESEDNIISVENKNIIENTVIKANQKVYAILKDNSEEYVDRSPERLYAKAGEYFNEPICSIETVGEDTYFNTTTRSIRWANDIGVFFDGHDEYFTNKYSSNDKGIYNHGVNQSKLYINDAGKVNIGKYIFYINGYNPLDTEPQTSVHNGIVVYDSQFDEYAVISSGKDKLHGTILSRIRPYCYYNNGYIYIFGGLERKDIHTADGNNYSKLNRTNKIERYDVRSGEFCILEALYGPNDSYNDEGNTDIKYCGEKEIRQLNKVGDLLKGTIRIPELSSQYVFEFDLITETSTNTSETYEGTSIVDYILANDLEIKLAKSTTGVYSLNSTEIVSEPQNIKTFEPVSTDNGNYLIYIEYLKSGETVLNKYLIKTSDSSIILLNSLSSKNDKLGNVYLKEINECVSDKLFNIGESEYLIDNSPIPIESRTLLSYKIGKVILKNITEYDVEIETFKAHHAITNIDTSNEVFFCGELEYHVYISSGKLYVKKYSSKSDVSSTSSKVTGTKLKAILQQDEDTIVIIVYNTSGAITNIFNYKLDTNKLVKRSFSTQIKLSDESRFMYNKNRKSIFVSSPNIDDDSFIVRNLTKEAIDNSDAVVVMKIDTKLVGYNLNNDENILGYGFDANNQIINIYKIDITNDNISCVLKNTIKVPISSTKGVIGNNEYLVSLDQDSVTFIYDSINSEKIKINETNYKILDINLNYIEYFHNDKKYRTYINHKCNFNGGKIVPLSVSIPKNNNVSDNANIYKYENNIYVISNKSIYRFNTMTNSTNVFKLYTENTDLIIGFGVYKNELFTISTAGVLNVLDIDTLEYVNSIKFTNEISNTANIKFTTDKSTNSVYFIINNVLYKYIDGAVDEISNTLGSGQLFNATYISKYNSIYYSMLNEIGNAFNVYKYNCKNKSITTIKSYPLNSISSVTSEYVNLSKASFCPNIMIDNYGNCVILGGNTSSFDNNPSHVLTINGSRYDDYVETAKNDDCNDLAYTSCIDDDFIYTLGIDSNGYANLVITARNENEFRGSSTDVLNGDAISSKKIFIYNNEVYGFDIFNKTNQIVKYNPSKFEFELYSLSALDVNGQFISAKAFEDGSLYLIFTHYNNAKIYVTVVCYNLNTKKTVYRVTEEVFDNTNPITQLEISNHSCWRGKYFITKLNTYSDNILTIINVLKRSNICVRSSASTGVFTGSAEYFNGEMYYVGDGNKYSFANLITPSETNITDADFNESSASLISGNRLLLTGISSKEITYNANKITKSVSKISRKNVNSKSFTIPYLNNTILTGTTEISSEFIDVNLRPDVYDLVKSPVKEMKLSDKYGLRIYSGSTEDTYITYNISNYDIIDSLTVSKEYGLGISNIVKYKDNGYLVIHGNTPNISTIIYADEGKISFKRYDGTVYGVAIDTDTNIHTIQEVDLTMIFDNDMDERKVRSSN